MEDDKYRRLAEKAANSGIANLLGDQHLYQKADLDLGEIDSLPMGDRKTAYKKDSYGMTQEYPYFQPGRKEAQNLLLTDPWVVTGQAGKGGLQIKPPAVQTYCHKCKKESTVVFDPAKSSEFWRSNATAHLVYGCPICSSEIGFLVRRKMSGLFLTGRDPIEKVEIRKSAPQVPAAYLSEAVLAIRCNCHLAGAFLCRTAIEQHWRSVTDMTGRATGDQMAERYASGLPSNITDTFGTLRGEYDILSEWMHAGKVEGAGDPETELDKEQQRELEPNAQKGSVEAVLEDILTHFDGLLAAKAKWTKPEGGGSPES